MEFIDVYHLPSGRIFKFKTDDGFEIESTEMRDVKTKSKEHFEVRNSDNPRIIWKHIDPYINKWLLTVSTQKGCVHKCKFCDVAQLGFHGNLTTEEITEQIRKIIIYTPYVNECKKVKIGFARMGEPAHNLDNVLKAMKMLPEISESYVKDFKWLPCFNTILPIKIIGRTSATQVLKEVIEFKEKVYNGFLHLQLSCNSTDEKARKELFGGADVLPLADMIDIINKEKITNRTVTLNFIVMENTPIEISELKKMGIDSSKVSIKLIPMNRTDNAEKHGLKTYANYSCYEKLIQLGEEFAKEGFKTVVDSIAKCEEAGLCCGQLVKYE